MSCRRVGFGVLCGLLAGLGFAPAAAKGETEADYLGDLPVVLSVARLQQRPADVPGFVTLISAKDIRYSGARDLAELLRVVPGFQVAFSSYGAPVAGYHGFANDVPKGLQVLIDGRSQHSTLAEGGVGWNSIDVPLEDIERIEVLRGSNSAAYGSNAFMGVVNVITRRPADTPGAAAIVSNGNQGVRDRYARYGFGLADWNARLSAESRRDDGEPAFFDSRETSRINLRADGNLTAADRLRLSAGWTRVDLGVGYAPFDSRGKTAQQLAAHAIEQRTNPRRVSTVEADFLQADWQHHDADAGDTEVRVHHIGQSMDDFYRIDLAPLGIPLATDFNNSGRATRDAVDVQHTIGFEDWRLVGGLGWRHDVARHAYFFGAGRRVTQTIYRLFGQLEWRPDPRITANIGATAEDHSLTGYSLSPRAALNLHLLPNQTVKFVLGRSQRLPTLYESSADERLFETVGAAVPVGTLLNVDRSSSGLLRPERVFSKEVGYLGSFPDLGLTLDARGFREDIKDRIQSYAVDFPVGSECPVFEQDPPSSPCGDYDDFFNVIDARIQGWELAATWQPGEDTALTLARTHLRVRTHWSSATRPAGAVEVGTLDYLAQSAPAYASALSFRHRLATRFTLAVAYTDVETFKWTQNGRTDAYQRLDWRLGYEFRLAGQPAELSWTVRADGSNHAEWWSRSESGDVSGAELLGTRHFLSLRIGD
jgi:iron complex outermembrane receptor protein